MLTQQDSSRSIKIAFSVVALAVFALLIVRGVQPSFAQEAKKPATPPAAGGGDVARGKYIVENVAMCQTCHTPRTADGNLIMGRWLQGGPVPYLPAEATNNWPQIVPRIGGRLPANKEQMITLLTTAKWIDGNELRDPMPKFHMNRADAEAVVAYLQTVGSR